MNQSHSQALAFLQTLKGGVSLTNLSKGVINNRDAVAYIFAKCGPMKTREVKDILNLWRHWEGTTWTCDGETAANLSWNYLFNTSTSGGYGCVGNSFNSKGIQMHGYSGSGGPTWFRRHYWFRVKIGHYAPTLECFKRMSELFPHGLP